MFNQLKKGIRKFFGVSKTEVNGILILFLILILIFLLPFIYTPILKSRNNNTIIAPHLLDSLVQVMEASYDHRQPNKKMSASISFKIFPFNPNKVTFKNLISLGIDTIVAKRVIKYRNSGGRYRKKEDLKKIYGLDDSVYLRLEPWIDLPVSLITKTSKPNREIIEQMPEVSVKMPKKINPRFDLNKADTVSLITINGIGRVYSSRIIKYRNLLGGFISLNQLTEVYGLSEMAIENLMKEVFIDSTFNARHIKINFAEWHEIVRHPYISSNLANAIINGRSSFGPIKHREDLFKLKIAEDSVLEKIEPYIFY